MSDHHQPDPVAGVPEPGTVTLAADPRELARLAVEPGAGYSALTYRAIVRALLDLLDQAETDELPRPAGPFWRFTLCDGRGVPYAESLAVGPDMLARPSWRTQLDATGEGLTDWTLSAERIDQ